MTTTDQPDTSPSPPPDKPASPQQRPPATSQKPKTGKKKKTTDRTAEKVAERRAHLKAEREERAAVELQSQTHFVDLLQRIESGEQDSPFREIQHGKKRAFLCAYALLGAKDRACRVAGIDQSTIYTRQWADDAEFVEAVERARVMAVDVLTAEAVRRAVYGVEEPVGWYLGEPGGYVKRYSDTLLIFLMKGADPERYRERVDVRGSMAHIDFNRLTDEQLARIAAGESVLFVVSTPGEPVAALPPAVSGDTNHAESKPERQETGE